MWATEWDMYDTYKPNPDGEYADSTSRRSSQAGIETTPSNNLTDSSSVKAKNNLTETGTVISDMNDQNANKLALRDKKTKEVDKTAFIEVRDFDVLK